MILASTAIKYTAVGVAVTVPPVVAVMSEGMLTAILVAIPAILTVVGVIIVNIITALKKTVDASAKTVEEVKVTAGNIEGHVNSAAAAAAAKILGLENEIKMMRSTLNESVQAAALLAQSRALEVMARVPDKAPIPVVVENPTPAPVTVKKP